MFAFLFFPEFIAREDRRQRRSVAPSHQAESLLSIIFGDFNDLEAPRPALVKAGLHFNAIANVHGPMLRGAGAWGIASSRGGGRKFRS